MTKRRRAFWKWWLRTDEGEVPRYHKPELYRAEREGLIRFDQQEWCYALTRKGLAEMQEAAVTANCKPPTAN